MYTYIFSIFQVDVEPSAVGVNDFIDLSEDTAIA